MKLKTTLTLEKETKNTYRYQEDQTGKPPILGYLYLKKQAVGSPPPKKIYVTIETEGEEAS